MAVLAHTKKWDALVARGIPEHRAGSVRLGDKGKTRRGIATGDNNFFLLNRSRISDENLPADALKPCIGRAADVSGFIFDHDDFERLAKADRRIFLFDPTDTSNSATKRYIEKGEHDGTSATYLSRSRKPWYRAEQRPPAPIWITVFGRGRLKFIRNKAGIKNLTAFHCFYPDEDDPLFADALVACLNSDVIAQAVAKQQRVYGGGLLKIEPADILDIDVPDLRQVSSNLVQQLAHELSELDSHRAPTTRLNALVESAFKEAANREARLL
jgi:adenine-specific DNA-methyltransferase